MTRKFVGWFAVSMSLGGCSSERAGTPSSAGPDSGASTYLGLATPADGFQVRNVGTTIPAGADEEFCEVAELPGTPGEELFVSGVEMANGARSHHLILSVALPGTEADRKLRAMNVGDRVPCVAAEMAFGSGLQTIGGIQHPYGKSELPAGIAERIPSGARVVFDYHYFNDTAEDVEARSAFNLHVMDRSEVTQLSGGFGFVNWTIDTPPKAKGSFIGDCRFQNDAKVYGLARHTHRWGRDFSAWFSGGRRDGEVVWSTPDYETNTDYAFPEPVVVRAGEGFKFECTYDNTEDHSLRFGTRATDEMCILFGSLTDASGGFEPPREHCDVTWVDSTGVGHDASAEGGFPAPDPAAASACLAGAGASAASACTQCSCDSCATVLIQCFADPDCGPIAQCSGAGNDCEPVIEAHSSGVGLSRQVGECIRTKCGEACNAGDAGQ